jgi:hypothetical protein
MDNRQIQLPAKKTLLLILVPMLATFACQRLYLHLVRVRHIFAGGILVHHLFIGVLIELPAAFVLAFGPRNRVAAVLAPAALGIGSAMILDEMTYLAMTQASDTDYVSGVSLGGALGFMTLAVLLVLSLFCTARKNP